MSVAPEPSVLAGAAAAARAAGAEADVARLEAERAERVVTRTSVWSLVRRIGALAISELDDDTVRLGLRIVLAYGRERAGEYLASHGMTLPSSLDP